MTAALPLPQVRVEARAVRALIGRDWAIKQVLRYAVVLDLAFGMVNLVLFLFVSRAVRHGSVHAVRAAGSYFDYVAVGIAFMLVIQTASTGMTRQIRDEQRSGTLEYLAAQPMRSPSLALGLAGFPFAFAAARASGYLALAVALGLDVSRTAWLGILLVLAASTLVLLSIGIALAALALVLDRGDLMARVVAVALSFASGAYFPVTLFPSPFHEIAQALPTTLALDGLRAALRGGSWIPYTGLLTVIGAVCVPLALAGFAAALRSVKRRGRLTRAE